MTSFIKRRIVTNETLGERLRKIREGRGLDFEAIEIAINIRAGYLGCLEKGDYISLPGEVYVKNFLKIYGSFLGLSGEEVIEQYEQEQRVDDYRMMVQHAVRGRDLFGNKIKKDWQRLGWKELAKRAISRSSLRSVVLSQIFIKGIIVLLIAGVLFYLGWEVKKIITPPDLTVLKPTDNLVITEPRVEILGIVDFGAELIINGSETVYDEKGKFEEVIDLKEGLNEIKITAKKRHSREVVEVRRVLVK